MRLDPRWIVFDLADTGDGDRMIHSIGGIPCNRTVRRAVKVGSLDVDRDGAALLSDYARTRTCTVPGLHADHHVVEHPTYGPTAVAVWLHETPPQERGVLNSWVLDLAELTTVTAGDDVSLMADGRQVGEQRPIQDLWRYLNPADAAALVTRYKDAVRDPDNTWVSIEWTLNIPDAEPLHMFSGGRLRVDGDRRTIVGTSIVLTERTAEPPDLLGPLVQFAAITLAVVNREARGAVTSIGTDAPLSYRALCKLVTEYDLYTDEEFTVVLDGIEFRSRVVPLVDPDGGAATVMLRRKEAA